jgi:adenylate kinase
MGETLRALDANSALGKQIQQHLHSGQLVPAELVVATLLHEIEAGVRSAPESINDILILDGVPRNVEQAQLLTPHFAVECVIHLACLDDSIMHQRIRSRAKREGRPDDADDNVIHHRFEVYRQETEPLLSWYPAACIASVDATKGPLEVLAEITAALVARQNLAPAVG